MVVIDMDLPTNCAHCPCLSVTAEGVMCGVKQVLYKKICPDSLYFDEHRPVWCPMKEVKTDEL